tara:strand:+ start:182 stop:889 length:708 start_codon:yes stop_codon:yes gene_type:complete
MTWIRILFVLMLSGINGVSTFALKTNRISRRTIIKNTVISTSGISKISNAADNSTKKEKNIELEPLTVLFYGPVSEEACLQLSTTLIELDKQAKIQKINFPGVDPCISLHIQSGGGSLMPTFYVCDTMKRIETPIYVYIDGYAASAASLISVCGDKRFMTEHSALLIHQLSGSSSGKFNELKNEMTNFNFFMNNVRNIYLNNTKLDENTLEELLLSDIWLDSKICLRYGLIDEII